MRPTSILVPLALIVSCTAPQEETDFRIINGDPAPSSEAPEYAATVGLQFKVTGKHFSTNPSCSGTLIAPDVVMTAGHCLIEQKGLKLSVTAPGDVLVFFGDTAGQGQSVPVSQTWVHPSYDPYALHNDIGLLRLASPSSVTPVPPLPAALALSEADVTAGTLLDFVGFGYADLAKTDYGQKLHNDLPLGALGCPQSVYPSCPADAPTDTQFSYAQIDDAAAETQGPCNGDSGGPAFVARNGQTYVAGITSYGDAACDDYGVSTTVSAFEAEIAAFVDGGPTAPDCSADGSCNPDCAADADPDCAPDCSADGTCNPDCAAGDDPDCDDGDSGGSSSCGDGVCDAHESCDGRYDTTECDSDCPGKTNGKPDGRFCWVGDTCEGPGC